MDSDNWQKIKELFNSILDLPADQRGEILSNCDEAIRREVENLIEADNKAEDFIVEPAFIEIGFAEEDETDFYTGKQIDTYKILKVIGQGGMGTVYLANRADESFEKKVAVKLIKRGMDTSAVLKRFVTERQILARLEHPNIALLLDGGTTEESLPYFVMEFVEGLPITKFCNLHRYSTEERLKIFQSVCSAVSYAHQNLVVHRDLKPSNILVTEEGSVKLLDFGIAKLLNPDWSNEFSEATATVFRAMTPEYASPEQLRGLPVTTASDVYSLGIVLYELLTGKRPFTFESHQPEKIAEIVLTEEPVKPSSVISQNINEEKETSIYAGRMTKNDVRKSKIENRNLKSLRGDLDNIILKALRKEPQRRYLSVQEFSEDIRRHLIGLPVTATADTTFYRLNKFVGRHRAGVFAGFLMFLTLFLATAITTRQSIVAKREQAKAEMHFNQVRKLVNTVLFEYHDAIANLAGATEIREKMVKDSLEYLNNLSAENEENNDLQQEIATAYQKIGDVMGSPFQGNLGNIEGALDSYHKSLAIREKLYGEHPNDVSTQRSLAKTLESIGNIDFKKGEYAESNIIYSRCLQIYEKLSNAAEATIEDKFGMAQARHRIGFALLREGDSVNALENFKLGLEKYEEVTALAPDVKKYQNGKGGAFLKIGDILIENGDLQKGIDNHQRAMEIWSNVSASEPFNILNKRNQAIARGRLAEDLEKLEDFEGALKYANALIDTQIEIAAADPKNVQSKSDLGSDYAILGSILGKKKEYAAAKANMLKSIEILRDLSRQFPDDAMIRRDLGLTYFNAGNVFGQSGNAAEAVENYGQAILILELEPLRSEASDILALSLERSADSTVLLSQKELAKKRIYLSQALKMYGKSVELWSDIQQKGQLIAKYSTRHDEINQKIGKCAADLALLQ